MDLSGRHGIEEARRKSRVLVIAGDKGCAGN